MSKLLPPKTKPVQITLIHKYWNNKTYTIQLKRLKSERLGNQNQKGLIKSGSKNIHIVTKELYITNDVVVVVFTFCLTKNPECVAYHIFHKNIKQLNVFFY